MILAIIILACIFVCFGLVVFLGAPYVPSQKKYVVRAFEHFNVGPSDTLIDVGSGDGIILRIASKFGAKAVGYEINPILVGLAQLLSLSDANVSVTMRNFWLAKLPNDTTIVYAFAVSRDGRRLARLMQNEANRLQKPLKLLCLASPFKDIRPVETFEAYHLYIFHPLQVKNA